MATVIDPTTSIQKNVDVSINGKKPFTEKVFFLEIWSTGNVSSQKTFEGTASEFSISGLSAGNTNTVIRISKTISANDVPEMYNGPAERVEVKVEPNDGLEPQASP